MRRTHLPAGPPREHANARAKDRSERFEIGPEPADTPGVDPRAANTLGDVLDRLQPAGDRREGLRLLAETLVSSLACDRATLWTQTGRRRPHVLLAQHPRRQEDTGAARPQLEIGELEGHRALARGRCVVIPWHTACAATAILRDALQPGPTDEILLLPFAHAGRDEGIAACVHAGGTFSVELRALWERIAPHVAVVLSAWRLDDLHARMRTDRDHFATLAADVLKATDVESTAVRICELTRVLFGTTRSAFFMLEDGDLVPIAAAGAYGDRASGGSLHVAPGAEPVFDEALLTRQVLVINEFRSSRYAVTPIPLPFRPQAALVIPLVDGSGTLGILTASELDDPKRFDPSTAEQARVLGAVATVAVRRMLLLEDLRRAGRAKDDFLAAVSHELRTPLNVVLGYVQLLTENTFGPLTNEQADTIRRVETGARSQLALVNDLLDLAKIERGGLVCVLAPVRVADLVEELTDIVQALVAGRSIVFTADVPAELLVHSDRERLKQVLVNLLGNAAKFTERGEIKLRAARSDASVAIEVVDTGVGMEPGFLMHATEPFVRGDGGSTGSGVGLAIVARVLRALGGSLAIDSRPGVGTTVRIELSAADHDGVLRAADP